jgi:hypothetical protein
MGVLSHAEPQISTPYRQRMSKMRHTPPESYLRVPELERTPRVGAAWRAICARWVHGYLPSDSVQTSMRPLQLESRMKLLECQARCVKLPSPQWRMLLA